ncbi:hypothetical protein V8C86DRAFT_2912432 [Haematococcus lacustris]
MSASSPRSHKMSRSAVTALLVPPASLVVILFFLSNAALTAAQSARCTALYFNNNTSDPTGCCFTTQRCNRLDLTSLCSGNKLGTALLTCSSRAGACSNVACRPFASSCVRNGNGNNCLGSVECAAGSDCSGNAPGALYQGAACIYSFQRVNGYLAYSICSST